MSAPLLTTKLFIPTARADRVGRPRLVARLSEVLRPGRKLALLCAPAGFGKTSLLADWTNQLLSPWGGEVDDLVAKSATPDRRVAWLSLDSSDDDPIRFWTYVLAALNMARLGIGDSLRAALEDMQPPPIDVVLTALLNELATNVAEAEPLTLILDDYHHIVDPAIHDQLRFLIERLPPCCRLVIASRSDPILPLARWRARNHLVEFRAADLRFSAEEAAAFLNDAMGLRLGEGEVAALEARTEGWIAGLHLAALAMRDRSDLATFVATFTGSNRFVVDFLADEVLRLQPPFLQDFLLKTSILDRMCGSLCDAVAGSVTPSTREGAVAERPLVNGQEILEQLERSNLFTVQLDDERRWYRYHHLFHAVLRERLEIALSPDEIAALHLRASAWLADHRLIPEAVEHALAGADYPRAADLIESEGLTLIARGLRSQVLAWLDRMPAEIRRERPRLGHVHAVILIQTNQTLAGEAMLAQVERNLASIPSEAQRRVLHGQILLSRAVLSWYNGDAEAGIRCAQRSLELLPESVPVSSSVAAIYAASAFRITGDVTPAAERRIREAVALGRSVARDLGQVSPYAVTLVSQGRLHVLQGRLRQASTCFGQARDLLHAPIERWTGHVAHADVAQGELLWELDDRVEAERLIRHGFDLMEGPTTAGADNLLAAAVRMAWIHQVRGDYRAALAALAEFDDTARQRAFFPGLLARSAAERARLSLAHGDLAEATRWAEFAGLSVDDDVPFFRENEYLILARLLIARRQTHAALRILERRLADAEANDRGGSVIVILLLQALTHQAAGDSSVALVQLHRALSLAAPEGYVRTFVDEGPGVAELLRKVRESRPVAEYVDRLLCSFGEESALSVTPTTNAARPDVTVAPAPPSASLAEPVSERELEVLGLIAAGYSNQEIADALVIALGTVKKHINNLYGKLAVNSRTQALARARDLGLL